MRTLLRNVFHSFYAFPVNVTMALILCCSFGKLFAQSIGDSSIKNTRIFYSAEIAPEFPGGRKNLYHFIADSLIFSEGVLSPSDINKVAILRFVISETGTISYGEIERGVSKKVDEALLNLLEKMPVWIPARQNGRNVPIWITLPVIIAK